MSERVTTLPAIAERKADSHKGDYGRVLIIGGSRGMSGAVALAGKAALRGGVGLVYLAVPDAIQATVAALEPAYLSLSMPTDAQGRLSANAIQDLEPHIADKQAIAIGPGMGQSDEIDQIMSWLHLKANLPLIVDADGLNSLGRQKALFGERTNISTTQLLPILTPHPGEFARLLNCSISEVQQDRQNQAVNFAQENHVVLVLKGSGTVITDGTRLAINATGNSGMATGGTGDVLTGLIAALLAQGLESFAAAQLGVYLHGLAGDLAADALTQQAMTATDLLDYLPTAWKFYLNKQ